MAAAASFMATSSASFIEMSSVVPTFLEAGYDFDMYNANQLFDGMHEMYFFCFSFLLHLFHFYNNFKWQFAMLISFIFAIM